MSGRGFFLFQAEIRVQNVTSTETNNRNPEVPTPWLQEGEKSYAVHRWRDLHLTMLSLVI